MEGYGKEPTSEVLSAYPSRKETVVGRAVEVGPVRQGHCGCDEAGAVRAIMLYQRLKFAVFCLFRRRRAEIELEEEIGAHLAMAEQERRDRGETPREAQQNARRELGNELL